MEIAVGVIIIREMRRATYLAATMGMCLVGASCGAIKAAPLSAPICTAAELSVEVSSQGENTTSRVDVLVVNRGSKCRFRGTASLAILRGGRRIKLEGNPLKRRFNGVLVNRQTDVLRGDWMNWCGKRNRLRAQGRLGSRVASGGLRPSRCASTRASLAAYQGLVVS